eukprot:g73342.t1
MPPKISKIRLSLIDLLSPNKNQTRQTNFADYFHNFSTQNTASSTVLGAQEGDETLPFHLEGDEKRWSLKACSKRTWLLGGLAALGLTAGLGYGYFRAGGHGQDAAAALSQDFRVADNGGFDEAHEGTHTGRGSRGSKVKSTQKRVLVVGGGMAGHHAMYELARAGIGNSSNRGPSGNTGILLIEKDNVNCGILRDITYSESSGLNNGPYQADWKPSASYKPYRMGSHGTRINIASTPAMRCLAWDLNISMYYTPWVTETQSNGYVARNGRWNCARAYTGTNGFVGDCTNAGCDPNNTNGYFPSTQGCSDTYPGCCDHAGYTGAAQLVNQMTGILQNGVGQTLNVEPAFNLNTYSLNNPSGGFDPQDEFYGWLVGFPGYVNPTFNYLGDGKTYNNYAYQYDPNDPNQNHPIQICQRAQSGGETPFGSVQGMYEEIVGPAYANFLCKANVGFIGDCQNGLDPCGYIPWTYREYNTLDEGYPVGGLSEICIREKARVQKNYFKTNVAAEYSLGELALDISFTKGAETNKGKYVVTTDLPRKIYADEVLIGIGPKDMDALTGDVANLLNNDPHTTWPKPVEAMTVTVKWNANTANSAWFNPISDNLWGSFRRIDADSLSNRLELFNTPYHRNGKMHAYRIAYNDFNQLQNWKALADLDNPSGAFNHDAGYPKYGHVYNQTMRIVREQWLAAQNAHYLVDPATIPDADHVYMDVEDESWWFSRPGSKFDWVSVWQWAKNPLNQPANAVSLGMIHGSYMYIFAGWSASAVNMTRTTLSTIYPKIPLSRYQDMYYLNGSIKSYGINAHCEGNLKPDWNDNWRVLDAAFATDMDTQYDYTNGLPNEHFPPYTNTQGGYSDLQLAFAVIVENFMPSRQDKQENRCTIIVVVLIIVILVIVGFVIWGWSEHETTTRTG